MPQFRETGFTFNGKSAEDYGYYIVNVEDSKENEVGLKKLIQEVDNDGFAKTFTGIKYGEFTFTIELMKMEQKMSATDSILLRPVRMEESDFNFINNWLMKPKEYKQFISHQNKDIIYYAMFTDMREMIIGNYNYITLTMRLNGGCAYSTIIENTFKVKGTMTVHGEEYDSNGNVIGTGVVTKSTVDEYIYPDIEIKVNSGSTVTIRHDDLLEEMSFTGLTPGYTYICYNEGIKHFKVLDKNGNQVNVNMRPLFNKTWLRLNGYGSNNLTITAGNCDIKIYFQNRIAIQH